MHVRLVRLPLILLVAAVASCGLFTDPGFVVVSQGDDSLVPKELRVAYRDDAARLAVRRLIATDHRARDDVRIPEDLVASIYSALIHVYNATALAARDSVVELYRIHSFPVPSVRRLSLGVNREVPWVQALRRGEHPTGNPEFDALVETYGLTLERYYDLSSLGFDLAAMPSREPLNMQALTPLFQPIEGVVHAGPGGCMGDGNDIVATMESEAWRLDYSVGFGDCPAGCTERHTWTFRIFADGRVRYDGSSGPPPPRPRARGRRRGRDRRPGAHA